jgi:alkylated DNA repair dioxygenase AlkB
LVLNSLLIGSKNQYGVLKNAGMVFFLLLSIFQCPGGTLLARIHPMSTLFPVEPQYPEGFQYVPNFINEAEESHLSQAIAAIPLRTFMFQGYEAKRKVASFGQDWSFEHQRLTNGKAIPQAFQPLIDKVASHLSLKPEAFAELLLTEYPAGSVINWHRDAPPFNLIAGVSLGSGCTFRLRPHDKVLQGKNSIISLPVQARSLYVMQGPSRSEWQHSIAPVNEVRYSITLRTLRL